MSKILFYTYPSCTSCRKTKKWLKTNDVNFSERHIFRESPSYEELLHLLSQTTDGLDEILATRSQSYKNLDQNINELPLSVAIKLIIQNPKLLKRPILTDGNNLVIGYNPEGLRTLTNKKTMLNVSC